MGLFISRKEREEKKTLRLIETASDSSELARLARYGVTLRVRLAAAARIENEDALLWLLRGLYEAARRQISGGKGAAAPC